MHPLLCDFRFSRSIVPLDQRGIVSIFGVGSRGKEKEKKKDNETGHRMKRKRLALEDLTGKGSFTKVGQEMRHG